LEGDSNSLFFHQFANGRRRKNTISFLNSDSREIRGQKGITDHIVGFYKNIFGPSVDCSMSLSDGFWLENLKLSDLDRDSLILPFQFEEVKGVVMGMRVNFAPRPNGFSVIFFQKCWDVIQGDLMGMF
jgi:hypothetical protein